MNVKLLLRVTSALFVLFAAGHTFGFLKFRPTSLAAAAVFDSMNTVTFEIRGRPHSYGEFYRGFGLTISVYLLLAAYVAWYLASISSAQPKLAAPVIWALTVAQAACVVLSFRYFSLVPAALSVLTAACLTWAAVKLSWGDT